MVEFRDVADFGAVRLPQAKKLCSDYLLEHSFIEVLGLLFDKK